jgi:chemotaxis protein methyltransferase CheR
MAQRFSDIMLRNLSEFLSDRMGLYFPERRWRDLEKGIISAARELGCSSPDECITRLLSSDLTKSEIEILASYLTVGETYFFRDRKSFESLQEYVLPELIRTRSGERRLRIWSAACSTGEEPYSLAILLQTKIPDIKTWNISILATDINPRFLEKARTGVYGDWSFRDCPSWIRNRHFEAEGDRYRVKKDIRDMVTFTYHNLAEDSYPALINNTAAMDLILCRNVLMYFSDEGRTKVVSNLYRSLVDNGFLFVSASEISHILFSRYEPVAYRGMTFYRKNAVRRGSTEESADLQNNFPLRDQDLYFPEVPDMIAEDKAGADYLDLTEACKPASVDGGEVPAADSKEISHSFYEEGLALFERGHYAEAADKMKTALTDKFDTAASALLARAYANLGEIAEALEWGRKAVSSDRMNPALHYLVAVIEQEAGHAAEAAASLRKALYLDHNFAIAHFTLGNLMLRMGRPAESARHFENALSVLRRHEKDEILPEADGITAGRLADIIKVMTFKDTTKEKIG